MKEPLKIVTVALISTENDTNGITLNFVFIYFFIALNFNTPIQFKNFKKKQFT